MLTPSNLLRDIVACVPRLLSVWEAKECIRELVAVFGEPRIELFARERAVGWDCWGNEVESDIELKDGLQ